MCPRSGSVPGDNLVSLPALRSTFERARDNGRQGQVHRTQHERDASGHAGDRRRVRHLVEDLVATLNKFGVADVSQAQLLGILGPLRGDIVEVESTATGTPLPETYQPAPSLAAV